MNIGRYGETLASEYLISKNYIILQRNFYTRIGEIDLIAEYDKDIVFIEVKTRIGYSSGYPYEAITSKKLSTIRRVARIYLQEVKKSYEGMRLDVISLVLARDLEIETIQHFENVDL